MERSKAGIKKWSPDGPSLPNLKIIINIIWYYIIRYKKIQWNNMEAATHQNSVWNNYLNYTYNPSIALWEGNKLDKMKTMNIFKE